MNQPLFEKLFTDWNEHPGLAKLGTDDYLLLLKLLDEKSFVIKTFDDFKFVIETLWLKSQLQREAFDQFFTERRRYVTNFLAQQAARRVVVVDGDRSLPKKPEEVPHAQGESGKASGERDAANPVVKTKEDKPEAAAPELPEQDQLITLALGSGTVFNTAGAYTVPENTILLPPSKKYLLDNEYFPLPGRMLQQNWRNLYSNVEANTTDEVDMQKTINTICREGSFIDFEYESGQENLLSLFIFIDQGGSMVACEAFGKELVESARASDVHQTVKPYFFYNLPVEHANPVQGYVVYNEQRNKAYTTHSLFRGINKKNIVLLLYGDAGAIKGNSNEERLKNTQHFLKYMNRHTAATAWLNPAPAHRWPGTDAAAIRIGMPGVSMFETSRSGIAQAINALKGKAPQPANYSNVITRE